MRVIHLKGGQLGYGGHVVNVAQDITSFAATLPRLGADVFSPWAHTSDGSYIYQLSLVLATATVSFYQGRINRLQNLGGGHPKNRSEFFSWCVNAPNEAQIPVLTVAPATLLARL